MLVFFLYSIFFVFLIAPQVYATQRLTLKECISLALNHNDTLKASLSNVEMHKQEAKISYSELFPKFRSEVQYSLLDRSPSFIIRRSTFSPAIPASDVELPAGERDIYAFTFSIEQPIFTGGYLTNNYERAKIQKKASEINSEAVRNELVFEVKSTYYDILRIYKIKEILAQTLRQKEEQKRVIEERYKEGISIKEELLFLNADISKQKLELFRTENDLNIKQSTLKNLIGLNHNEEIVLADKLENKKLVIGLLESKDIALKNRKDLSGFYYTVKSAKKEIEIAESGFYPKTSVTGSYTRQRETPLANPDLWRLMLTVNWDVFEWGKTKADVKRAKAKHERLNRRYNALKKDVMLDVEEKWFKVKEAEEKVGVAKDSLIHAEEYYKNAILNYRENLLKTAELIEAETYLLQNKNEYINSIYDLNKALAEFEFSISADITPLVIKEAIYQSQSPQPPFIKGGNKGGLLKEGMGEFPNQTVKNYTKSPEHEGTEHLKQLSAEADMDKNNEYYVQVGAFKYAKNAQVLLKKLKMYYPDSYIVVTDNFNKVRIPDVKTKEQGTLILKEIKKKFNLKAILVLRKE